MKWLVTGGAGYIGSHVLHELISRGEQVIVLDSMASGVISRIPSEVKLYKNDIRDNDFLLKLFGAEKFDGIFHLAALKSVSDSFLKSELYFEVNTKASENIFELAAKFGIKKVIFSSTAAVYSSKGDVLKSESEVPSPENPYGKSKLYAENALAKYLANGIFDGTSLRYFNVIGSRGDSFKEVGGENLVPRTIKQIRSNKSPTIYGSDYETRDGTCIRDFVDVRDVAQAHILSALHSSMPMYINIGTGSGTTVLEVVNETTKALESKIQPHFAGRREGDVQSIVADISLAKQILSYTPQFSLSDSIVSSI